jgi:5-methylcytosine-specific restriction endonuclease McrA
LTVKAQETEAAYKEQNKEHIRETERLLMKQPKHLARRARDQQLRREAYARAHPLHREAIAEMYAAARLLSMTVDHIVPLYTETVWGLHAPQNLQLLTLEENSRKLNRLYLDG